MDRKPALLFGLAALGFFLDASIALFLFFYKFIFNEALY
jgi:hypothetical protein